MATVTRIQSSAISPTCRIWNVFMLIGVALSQEVTVTFRIQDEVNNAVVFATEKNIQLACVVEGFSNDASVEIRHEKLGTIEESDNMSENFAIETLGKTTTLTIKEVVEETGGQYTCAVIESGTDAAAAIFDLTVVARFNSPQCYSSQIVEGGNYIKEGDTFSSDCFYENVGTSNAKWLKIDKNGSESEISSTKNSLQAKFRRRLTIPEISEDEDGISFKCVLNREIAAITIPPNDCAIGPIGVIAVTTTTATTTISTSSLVMDQSTPVSLSPSTTGPTTTTPQPPKNEAIHPTDDGESLHLEDIMIYIIIGGVVVAIILCILLGLCICCCCCRQNDGKDVENLTNEVNGNPTGVYDTMPYDSKKGGPIYDSPPIANSGYSGLKENGDRGSVVILGPEDMASTHL